VWANIKGRVPDGICLDAENAIWVACPTASEVIRVKQGGEIAERIKVETDAFACMLGGPDGRTLFIATAPNSDPEKCRAARGGRIETTQIEVPRAGLP
jgi:sugar lactone lactonase YvrE